MESEQLADPVMLLQLLTLASWPRGHASRQAPWYSEVLNGWRWTCGAANATAWQVRAVGGI